MASADVARQKIRRIDPPTRTNAVPVGRRGARDYPMPSVHPARRLERPLQAGLLTSGSACLAGLPDPLQDQWHEWRTLTGYSCGGSAGIAGPHAFDARDSAPIFPLRTSRAKHCTAGQPITMARLIATRSRVWQAEPSSTARSCKPNCYCELLSKIIPRHPFLPVAITYLGAYGTCPTERPHSDESGRAHGKEEEEESRWHARRSPLSVRA